MHYRGPHILHCISRNGRELDVDVIIVESPRRCLENKYQRNSINYNPNQDYTEDPMFLEGPRHYSINWANDVHTLIYASCGVDALARGCERLLKENAGQRLYSATGYYIIFP